MRDYLGYLVVKACNEVPNLPFVEQTFLPSRAFILALDHLIKVDGSSAVLEFSRECLLVSRCIVKYELFCQLCI